eukprot:sb/3468316/
MHNVLGCSTMIGNGAIDHAMRGGVEGISGVVPMEEPLSKVDASVYTQHLFLCRKEVQSADDVPSLPSHCVDLRNYRQEISDRELRWRYSVESAQFYRIILYDETATNDVLHCDIKVWLMNPDSNHLSSDQLLIPITYTIATFVWVLFLAIWFLNFAIFTRADDVPSLPSHCVDLRNYRQEISDRELRWRYSVESAQFYRIILYDETATNDVLHCDIKVWLMNPDSNHLSSDQLLIPITYTIATFVWVLFLAIWFLNFAIFTRVS